MLKQKARIDTANDSRAFRTQKMHQLRDKIKCKLVAAALMANGLSLKNVTIFRRSSAAAIPTIQPTRSQCSGIVRLFSPSDGSRFPLNA